MTLIQTLIEKVVGFLVNTPLYPYWLIFRTADAGNTHLLAKCRGLVINVGCGATDKRAEIENNSKVIDYLTLDYPGWIKNWKILENDSEEFGKLSDIIYRGTAPKPDIWGDGHHLPFSDKTIDTVVSLGVLEHIFDYVSFLKEKYRVLKPSGILLMTLPLLYQSHGGTPSGKEDYVRLTESGLRTTLGSLEFQAIEIKPYGGVGTMLSQLINSFIIKKVLEVSARYSWGKVIQITLTPFLAIVFLIINTICLLLDLQDHDMCYSAGFFVVAKKGRRSKYTMPRTKKVKSLLVCPRCHNKLDKEFYCIKCKKGYVTNNTLCFI